MLDGELTADEARAAIAAGTRRLARKQMGWFGRDPRVHWLDAQDPDLVATALDARRGGRRRRRSDRPRTTPRHAVPWAHDRRSRTPARCT